MASNSAPEHSETVMASAAAVDNDTTAAPASFAGAMALGNLDVVLEPGPVPFDLTAHSETLPTANRTTQNRIASGTGAQTAMRDKIVDDLMVRPLPVSLIV